MIAVAGLMITRSGGGPEKLKLDKNVSESSNMLSLMSGTLRVKVLFAASKVNI